MTLTQADLDFIAEAKVDEERWLAGCIATREQREEREHQEWLRLNTSYADLFETPTRFENWYYGEVVPSVKNVVRAIRKLIWL
jgi:hypothetical protein